MARCGQTRHLPAYCPPPILSPLPLTFCPPTHCGAHTNTHCPYGAVGAQKRPEQPDPFPGQKVRVPAACILCDVCVCPQCPPGPSRFCPYSEVCVCVSRQAASHVSYKDSSRGPWVIQAQIDQGHVHMYELLHSVI